MTNQEITDKVRQCYSQIKYFQDLLSEIRDNQCKHEETFFGNYSERIGQIQNAEICSYCGKLIKYV